MNRRDLLRTGIGVAALTALTAFVRETAAQGRYPEYPIRFIAPRAAGGVVDIAGRMWADRMTPYLGSRFIIENQTGGGGTIGATAVARAAPDGYTLLAGSGSELVVSYLIANKPTYDPINDFAAITINAVTVPAIMVRADLPVRTVPELVAYAKANRGKLSYGSAGAGTVGNLCGELFKQLTGLHDIVHVPYKGGNAALADLYGGQLPIVVASVSTQTMEMHKAGKLRILVASAQRRLTGAPEVPIGKDVGYPDFIAEMFMGVFAPAQTPRAIIDRISDASKQVMAQKDFQERLIQNGFEPVFDSGPEEAAAYLKVEIARWRPILEASGMKN
jgi:tripartite-type tricarboxylate transporter receptor subunit TctC